MKKLKHIVNWIVWTLLGLYALIMITIQLPPVQQYLGRKVAETLQQKLATRVGIGSIELGFYNRVIINDIFIYDKQQKEMLRAGRMTAKVELAPLTRGKIAISSAQIFGLHAMLYKTNALSSTNFQFVLDSLASKDTTSHTPLDLRINSFIMRHSSISYDQWDIAPTPGRLNPNHLQLKDISAHVNLKALKEDSINIKVKRLAFNEQSGLNIRRMAFHLVANNTSANLQGFDLQMQESKIHLDSVSATYQRERLKESIEYKGAVSNTLISPIELKCFIPWFKNYQHSLLLASAFRGTAHSITVPAIDMASTAGDVRLTGRGHYSQTKDGHPAWEATISQLHVSKEMLDFIDNNVKTLPTPLLRLGDIQLSGNFGGDNTGMLTADADVTTGTGSVKTDLQWTADQFFSGKVFTDGVQIGQIFDNSQLGVVEADLQFSGKLNGKQLTALTASGNIPTVTYNGHDYQNIKLDGQYIDNDIKGWLNIDDNLIHAHLEADLHATSLKDAVGIVSLTGLRLPEKDFTLGFLRLESGYDNDRRHFVHLNSDFAQAEVKGQFDYATVGQSIANIVGSKLPTLPGLPKLTDDTHNNFTVNITVAETDWLQKLTGISLQLLQPLTLSATVNDGTHQMNVDAQMPQFIYEGGHYENCHVSISAPRDTMFAAATLTKMQDSGEPLSLKLNANAADNNLTTALLWDNHNAQKPMNGRLDAIAHLYQNLSNQAEAHVTIQPSPVYIGGELWHVEASDMIYCQNQLNVNRFTIQNGEQFIKINGRASNHAHDSLYIDLSKMEVDYILDLVNFHSVEFGGKATGRATIASAFNSPSMHADLTVDKFTFQEGRMGTLTATVDWNRLLKQIDIDAIADDGYDARTFISGYVSPERNYIDLDIRGRGTHIDFLQSFTRSFLSDVGGHAHGEVRLSGPLSNMQLIGLLVVDGQATVKPLDTTYYLRNDTVRLVADDILLQNVPIYDKFNNVGILNGGIHHQHLTNLTFDLGVQTDLLLCYDVKDQGDQLFYGTVFADGTVAIQGRPGRVNIDCNVSPLQGTTFTYNVASPDAISNQEFITWRSKDTPALQTSTATTHESPLANSQQPTTDIYLNFIINANPDATLRLLMDAGTGDYITLNGSGVLRATYYNKGTFQMFGTYTVDHGTYGITIQNIISKNFTFNPGGTIIFGGDPYEAQLQLQASYPVQGVSLTDLSIGNSFSQATIRVNCLMNITGQPNAPRVDFDLDMPTVNADEQQMVRSVINGEQEMNQQVLYLLSIGRFYQQGQNNEQSSQDQTSLAMQSLLSGTLSSQLNNVLSSVIKNDDWNFGANISTGTEGWNNAEYEGIFNGRMLNNRLLINGQFGYRDNATQATPSFIGDFDIRYLLYPSGNLALKVYNQTNDRYFTRSSLNTQGIGIIMKKDFGRLDELFRKR